MPITKGPGEYDRRPHTAQPDQPRKKPKAAEVTERTFSSSAPPTVCYSDQLVGAYSDIVRVPEKASKV